MQAATVSAVAASCAVLVSLINVRLSAILLRRNEAQKWVREKLPDMVAKFTDAALLYKAAVYYTDWRSLNDAERHNLGMPMFKEAMGIANQMATFASPETISAAYDLLWSIDRMRATEFQTVDTDEYRGAAHGETDWQYTEAEYAFKVAARKEMGLAPPPMPRALVNRKKNPPNPEGLR